MNYKRLEEFFSSMESVCATISFDDIAQACGEIPYAYIAYKHLDKNYAFHQHIQATGYHITSVDYANRTFCVERCDAAPTQPAEEETAVVIAAIPAQTLETRTTETYYQLVSQRIDRRIARGIATENELLLYSISKRAFGAATAFEHFVPNSQIIAHKEDIVASAAEKIRQLQPGMDFDEWLYGACRDISFGMRFGVWQKILNITLKFMYLFHCRNGYFADYAWAWEKCHCPVDQIIRDIVVEKLQHIHINANIDNLNDITWNFITEEQYRYFQTVIRQFCDIEHIDSKMFFDVLYWRRPN